MAEWIEIFQYCNYFGNMMSPLAMAEWIEILPHDGGFQDAASPLAMAEWIEITKYCFFVKGE